MANDTNPPTITEFLLARIAADEAVAQEVQDGPGEPDGWGLWSVTIGVQAGTARFAHVATTPERILAECAAKRELVGIWHDEHGGGHVLKALAAVYSDHPDYEQKWAV